MKYLKFILPLILYICLSKNALAHYMWIETNPTGKVGKAQSIQVYFGEYTYGMVEDPKGDHYNGVKAFKVWVISPSGEKTEVATEINENGYAGTFTPTEKGTYVAVLNNDEIDVIDYTQYDFGIFKTHYHSTARIVVGQETKEAIDTNAKGLSVVDKSVTSPTLNGETKLQILYQGKPLPKAEVKLFMKDMWSKEMKTNEEGMVSFALPFEAKYILEVTQKEEVPGTYKDEKYEFIWHCATYCLDLTSK